MDDVMGTKDIITLFIASVGAVLGILNTWKAYARDRAKLRVVPKQAVPIGGLPDKRVCLCIEVTNLSTFALTISEVGVLYWWSRRRGAVVRPLIYDGGAFPRRLDSRSSFTAYLNPDAFVSNARRVRCAYARTDCGLTFTGNSRALQQLASRRAI